MPHRIVVNVMTGDAKQVEWTPEEWAAIQQRAAQIAAEEAVRPVVKSLEERIATLEQKVR